MRTFSASNVDLVSGAITSGFTIAVDIPKAICRPLVRGGARHQSLFTGVGIFFACDANTVLFICSFTALESAEEPQPKPNNAPVNQIRVMTFSTQVPTILKWRMEKS